LLLALVLLQLAACTGSPERLSADAEATSSNFVVNDPPPALEPSFLERLARI
jgi:hypothetical protein